MTKQGNLDFALENMSFNTPVSIVDIMIACGWVKIDYFSIRSFDVYFSKSKKKLKNFEFRRKNKYVIKISKPKIK